MSRKLIARQSLDRRIFLIRGLRVMMDRDLAELYQVPTKVLNQAVKRHIKRFPCDFMFQLNKVERQDWRSQFVTSNPSAKMGLRRSPYAFTEHGIAMLSSVLNSERAIEVNIAIMRAFIKLRQSALTHKDLTERLGKLELKFKSHDWQIRDVFKAILPLSKGLGSGTSSPMLGRALMNPPATEDNAVKVIGFTPPS